MYLFISYGLFYVVTQSIAYFATVTKDFFLLLQCEVTTVDLWRNANARY